MARKNESLFFSITDESNALLFSNNAISWISQPLTILLDRIPEDRDAVINALSTQEDGCLPILLGDQIWLSSSVSADNERIIILKNPSKFELEEWLEIIQGGSPSILTDGAGRIFALTESANMLFAGYDDEYKRPGALCFNSWGTSWIKGQTRGPQPEGTFWIDAGTVDAMLRQGDSFAYSAYVGFPRVNIPPYVLY